MKTPLKSTAAPRKTLFRLFQGLLLATTMSSFPAFAGDPELPVNLGSAGDFVILAKTGITNVPSANITGDMGVSPIGFTAITGFSLILDPSTEFSTSAQVTGKIYAANYGGATPVKMTTAISDMETAYTQASLRVIPNTTELSSGNIGGLTITPGLHKWSTDVSVANDVTLDALGNPDAVFIFQISGDLLVSSGKKVLLANGAQAKNIYWQIEGPVGADIDTTAHVEGIIMTLKGIILKTGATFNGKLFAQTLVTLDQNVLVDSDLIDPLQVELEIVSPHGIASPSVGLHTYDFGSSLTNSVSAVEVVGGTEYVNAGWNMTGNEPLSGITNEMTTVITNNAVLTWLWNTNHLLNASANPALGGMITDDPNGYYAEDAAVSVTATANPGYIFTGWTGDTSATPADATQNLIMDQPKTLVANFMLVAQPCGTPVTQGAVMELDMSGMFTGTDLTYAVVSSMPAFMSAEITVDDKLRLVALAPGVTTIDVTASAVSEPDQLHSFDVTVVGNPNVVSIEMAAHEPWNPRFEHRLVIENDTGIACPAVGIRLLFSDIQPGITIENQTGLTPAPDGRPMIEWIADFPDGAIQELSVIYLSSGAFRPDLNPPTIEVQYILANEVALPDQAGAPNIESIRTLTDGRVVLEFLSVPGATYNIELAPTLLGDWTTLPMLLTAGANRTQWIDYGPPITPPLTDARFYRVREVTP
jgi:uncharacterized repeat protein (TIGR02543 family)